MIFRVDQPGSGRGVLIMFLVLVITGSLVGVILTVTGAWGQ